MLLCRAALLTVLGPAVLALASCASPPSKDDAGNPALSIAWDAREGLRYLLVQGCIAAVDQNIPIKQAIDRGQVMSRVRTLDKSPLNDPEGTPAFAVLSSASVVMTGTPERCRVAAAGEMPALRETALKAVEGEGWVNFPSPQAEAANAAGATIDARCRPAGTGSMLFTLITPNTSANTRLVATVSRSASACPS
jgi:hypothetical protein